MTSLTAIFLSVCGAAVFMVQPVYLGAVADTFTLSGAELGLLAGVETGGALLASIAAPWWAKRLSPQQVATIAMLVLSVGNLACLYADSFSLLLLLRGGISLLGAGLAYATAFLLLAFVENRERAFSLAIFAQVSFGAAGLAVFPELILSFGADAIFLTMTGLAVVTLPLTLRLARTPVQADMGTKNAKPLSRKTLLLLSAQVIWFAGVGAVWAFIERIGRELGLTAGEVGTALSASIAISLLASLLAAWMAGRFGTRWQMPLMITLHLATFAALLVGGMHAAGFLTAMLVFNFFWNFALPYLLAAVARAEPDGRGAALLPACQTGALMAGPVIAGYTITGNDHSGVLLFAVSCYLVLAAIMLAAHRQTSGQER